MIRRPERVEDVDVVVGGEVGIESDSVEALISIVPANVGDLQERCGFDLGIWRQ